MSAYVLLNLLNELSERDKMRGLSSILSLFRNKFNKSYNTRAQMLRFYISYDIKNILKSFFLAENESFAIWVMLKTSFHNVT